MTHDELVAGARREMLRNILIAPIVLLIRLPLGLIYASLDGVSQFLMWADTWLPGWRRDYAQALRRERNRSHDA